MREPDDSQIRTKNGKKSEVLDQLICDFSKVPY
jgi:hypothetical protein